jgi:putative endonuclease
MNWTVYILECADGSLYTGITKDLTRRITEHETGKGACYTAGRSPFRLVYQEFHTTRSEATKRETAIKTMTRTGKLTLVSSAA